jgi:formate hydrogenlyase transcriptional activator
MQQNMSQKTAESTVEPFSKKETIDLPARITALKKLVVINGDIASAASVEQLQHILIQQFSQLVPFCSVLITLFGNNGENQQVWLTGCTKALPKSIQALQLRMQLFPAFDPLLQQVEESNEAILLTHFKNEHGLPSYFASIGMEDDIVESVNALLYRGSTRLGALFFVSAFNGTFCDHHLEIIKGLTKQLGMAVTNIVTLAENAAKQRMQATLLDLGLKIAASRDKKTLLTVVKNYIKAIVQFTDLVITLNEKNDETIPVFLSSLETTDICDGTGNLIASEFHLDQPMDLATELQPKLFNVEELTGQKNNYPAFLDACKRNHIMEFLSVPLLYSGNKIGTLFLSSKKENTFLTKDHVFLQGIADHMSLAIANISANDELILREKEKATLIAISNDIAAIKNRSDLQYLLDQRLKKLFFFTHTLIVTADTVRGTHKGFLFDPKSRSKNHKAYLRITKEETPIAGKLMTDAMYADGPNVIELEDYMMHAELPDWVMMNYECGIVEMILCPLRTGNKFIGWLVLFSDQKKNFCENDLQIMQGISWQLSNVVENMLVNEEIQTREEEKSQLLSFSNDLAAAKNRNELLMVIKKAFETFNIQHYLILLLSADDQRMIKFLGDRSFDIHDPFHASAGAEMNVCRNYAEMVFQSGQPIGFGAKDILKAGDIEPAAIEFVESSITGKIIGIPMRSGNTDLGIIWTHPFNSGDRMMMALASQIATALSNVFGNEQISRQFSEIENYKHQLENENLYLQEELRSDHNYSEIIGKSTAINKVFHMISQVAGTSSSVLLMGETGTGKELIARAIHDSSLRRKNLMVKVNCATLPPNLIESELFGHERGSFTGATERRIGKFELANNSTLFLDEVGELPLDLQVKLLRALQEKEIERIGGRGVIKTDVRIIAATNRNLHKEVQLGNFRSDLFFRLNVFPIILPPLRERRDDIPILAQHYLVKFAGKISKEIASFSGKVMNRLMEYNWPGNVRELEHLVERSVLLTNGNVINKVYLHIPDMGDINDLDEHGGVKTIDEIERDHIITVLKRCNNKISGKGGAAELLKIPSTSLNSKIRRLKINKAILEDF